jgi:ribose/xylose/arabinose/galactoside ABC-type transport system permease subunit
VAHAVRPAAPIDREKPSAADSLGVAVYRIKYIGVTISGALAGSAGAWLAIDVPALQREPGRRSVASRASQP